MNEDEKLRAQVKDVLGNRSTTVTVGQLKKDWGDVLAYFKRPPTPLPPELAKVIEAFRPTSGKSKLAEDLAKNLASWKEAQSLLAQTFSAKALLPPEHLDALANFRASIQNAVERFRQLGPIRIPQIDWAAIEERDEAAHRAAAKRNWFVQPETEAVFLVRVMDTLDDPVQFDKHFAAVITRDLDEIEQRLIAAFPLRAAILTEAFALQREGRHLASVPLMLLSAEGIAWDVTGKSVFSAKSGGKPQVSQWLNKTVPEGYTRALVAGISTDHPLSVPQPGQLNRHHVLHGRSADYGTKLFNLQATSFLGAIGWFFAPDGLLAKSFAKSSPESK